MQRRKLLKYTGLGFGGLLLSKNQALAAVSTQKLKDQDAQAALVPVPSTGITWKASWIWFPNESESVNFHFLARKTFQVDHLDSEVTIHISAYSDYNLYVNGKFLGRGPNPYLPSMQYFDSYSLNHLLEPGINTLAVLAHNYGVGLHWQPCSPGGLIAQVEQGVLGQKSRVLAASDKSWKVSIAQAYGRNSPRMQWSCKFLETFDFHRHEASWMLAHFDDRHWLHAAELGKHPHYPWESLQPRRIPFFNEIQYRPRTFYQGKYEVKGFHSVNFSSLVAPGENKIAFARTWIFSETGGDYRLYLGCDDALKVYLNGHVVVEQNYLEQFVRQTTWNRREDHEQFHYSVGVRNEETGVQLKAGWNLLQVAIDLGPGAWGFSLGLGKKAGYYQDFAFGSDEGKRDSTWLVWGPFESTGMKNSLAHINGSEQPSGKMLHIPGADQTVVCDYAKLMNAEHRTAFAQVEASDTFTLSEGENMLFDFGNVHFGHPGFQVQGEGILDIGYSNTLAEDKKINFIIQVRYVDRVISANSAGAWINHTKREVRYLHVSCRKGSNIRLSQVFTRAVEYPVDKASSFSCSDAMLDKIYAVNCHTTHVLMQDSWQDGIKREEGVHNTRSFIHQFTAGQLCFNNTALMRKNIWEGIATQEENGWFNSHGPTDNNADEPTEMLWWFELLRKYYQHSGDAAFLEEIYARAKGVLRYFSRQENMHFLLDCRNEFINTPNRGIYIDDNNGYYTGVSDKTYLGYNVLYYGALKAFSYLAAELGHADDARLYGQRAGYVLNSCNTLFWNAAKGEFYEWVIDDKKGGTCPTSIVWAGLYFDMFPAEISRTFITRLKEPQNGLRKFEGYRLAFGYYYLLFHLLFRNGEHEFALDLMKAYFGRWIELGGTTFGEFFDLEDAREWKSLQVEYNTHGYAPASHEHFYTGILGIQPQGRGFEKVLIAPQPGSLSWAKGDMYTPAGKIWVSWQRAGTKLHIEVSGPAGYAYTFKAPAGLDSCTCSLNGKRI